MKSISIVVLALVNNTSAIKLTESWTPKESRALFEKSVAEAAATVAEENSSENRRVAANRLLDDNDIRETFNEKARVTAGRVAMERGGPSVRYGGGHWVKPKTQGIVAFAQKEEAPWNPAKSRKVFDDSVKSAAATVAAENAIEAKRTAATKLLNDNDVRETFNEKARVTAGRVAMMRGGPSTRYWQAPASLAQGEEGPWNPAQSRKVFDDSVKAAAATVAAENAIEAKRTAATKLLNDNDVRETFNEKARVTAGRVAMERGGPAARYGGGHWVKPKTQGIVAFAQGDEKPWNPDQSRKVFDDSVKAAAATVAAENAIEAKRTAATKLLNDNDIRETFNEKARVRAGRVAMMRGGPPARYGGGHWKAPAASLVQKYGEDIGEPSVDPSVYHFVKPNIDAIQESRTGSLTGYNIPSPPAITSPPQGLTQYRKSDVGEKGIDEIVYPFVKNNVPVMPEDRGDLTSYGPPIKPVTFAQEEPTRQGDIGEKSVEPVVYDFVKPNVDALPDARTKGLTGYMGQTRKSDVGEKGIDEIVYPFVKNNVPVMPEDRGDLTSYGPPIKPLTFTQYEPTWQEVVARRAQSY